MPGYFFDIGAPRPTEGEFEAPSDALVAVYDSSARTIRGILTIGSIVERTGEVAPSAVVYDAVKELLSEGVAMPLGEPVADEGDVGSIPQQDEGSSALVSFREGVLVTDGYEIGIRPTWREWGSNRELSTYGSGVAGEAFRAMGSLPGFPVTDPGSRWYICVNGDRHFLPIGAEGSECPTCSSPLFQDD